MGALFILIFLIFIFAMSLCLGNIHSAITNLRLELKKTNDNLSSIVGCMRYEIERKDNENNE